MDANSINQVVNNLAEKAGVARDQVLPLAQRCVEEYGRQQFCLAMLCAVASILAVATCALCVRFALPYRTRRDLTDTEFSIEVLCLFGFVAGTVLGILSFVGVAIYASHAMAPTYEVTRQLLGK